MTRTLVFNFDGTCNQPSDAEQDIAENGQIEDENITNILKFHLLIGGTLKQVNIPLPDGSRSFYYPGVGTYGNFFQQKFNAGLAKEKYDVRRIIKMALADFEHYYHFDGPYNKILVTGFSRGAAIARRFAALINDKVAESSIIEAVFDTVASIGMPDLSKTEMPKTDVVFEHGCHLPSNVAKALHIVSLDEKRRAFKPTLMNQKDGVVTEVWFAGAHADVGGGYFYDGLADNSLRFFLDWFADLNLGIALLTAKTIDFDHLFDHDPGYRIGPDDVQVEPNILGRSHEQKRSRLLKWTLANRSCCGIQNDQPWPEYLPMVHYSVAERVLKLREYRPQALRNVKHRLLYNDGQLKQFFGYSEHKLFNKQNLNLPTPLGISTFAYAHQKDNKTHILVEQGKRYRIQVSADCYWNDGGMMQVDGDGWTRDDFEMAISELPMSALSPYRRVKSANWFALCGSIDGDDKTAFAIGNCLPEYSPPRSGELVLFANDLPGYYHNNHGKLKVNVFLID